MNMMPCPDCEKPISIHAENCIFCGWKGKSKVSCDQFRDTDYSETWYRQCEYGKQPGYYRSFNPEKERVVIVEPEVVVVKPQVIDLRPFTVWFAEYCAAWLKVGIYIWGTLLMLLVSSVLLVLCGCGLLVFLQAIQ